MNHIAVLWSHLVEVHLYVLCIHLSIKISPYQEISLCSVTLVLFKLVKHISKFDCYRFCCLFVLIVKFYELFVFELIYVIQLCTFLAELVDKCKCDSKYFEETLLFLAFLCERNVNIKPTLCVLQPNRRTCH